MMPTHAIWKREDRFDKLTNHHAMDMDPSVVVLPDKDLPLVWSYNYATPDSILGWCTGIVLEDGEITTEVAWLDGDYDFEKFIENDQMRLGGYYSNVRYSEDRLHIVHAELKGVSLFWEHSFPANLGGNR